MSLNTALVTRLSEKLEAALRFALLVCMAVISAAASVKLFLIAVKLSRKPCEELSCPAMGKVLSMLPGTMLLAMLFFQFLFEP